MYLDWLWLVAAAILIGIPIAVVILIIGFNRQKREIAALQVGLRALRRDLDRRDLPEKTARRDDPRAAAADAGPPTAAREAVAKPAAPAARPVPPPVPPAPRAPSPVAAALSQLGPWLRENWFYAVSALSLALAGIFLVQYGMENGLLPPTARVAAALAFGAALIGAGEVIRRRFGDNREATTAYLPSVFSGAGIVTLFGGILSARMLYDLIGGGIAMSGMVIVALIALLLGWLHGPLLAAIGIIGAYGAPVVLGSSDSDAGPLFGYFAVIAVLGLGLDTVRRWGWVSVLTLGLAYLMGWALWMGSGEQVHLEGVIYFAILPVLAILIPARAVMPDHAGPTVLEAALSRRKGGAPLRPIFPVYLAAGALAASVLLLVPTHGLSEPIAWLGLAALAALAGAVTLWSVRAPALQDLALLPAGGVMAHVWLIGVGRGVPIRAFRDTYVDAPEAGFPWAVTLIVLMGVGLSLSAAWRSLRGGPLAVWWAAGAAVVAPGLAILLEVAWDPAAVIGAYPWALHAAALAAVMVAMAERFARADGPLDRLRTSFAVIAALSSIAFAFVIVLSAAALTVALAVVVLAAAALDRKWNLPPLSFFVAAGVVTLGYRLVADPGLFWAERAPLSEVLLAYGGTLAAFIASLALLRPLDRPMARVMLDSAAWSTGGMLISLLLYRWIEQFAGPQADRSHWAFGLTATIWLGLALAQLQRMELAGRMRFVRWALAGLFGLIGAGSLLMAVTAANPLSRWALTDVLGPPVFNTLIAAYLLPAAVLLLGAARLIAVDRRLRLGLAGVGGALVALWAFLAIRHLWNGAEMMALRHGFSQPELYSYTVVLLLLGAGLFYQSLARRRAVMRKAGLVVIGLAVAKVFLVDISGLDGLTRVFSLLVLGLSLAALAWLNRWAQDRDAGEAPPPPVPGEGSG